MSVSSTEGGMAFVSVRSKEGGVYFPSFSSNEGGMTCVLVLLEKLPVVPSERGVTGVSKAWPLCESVSRREAWPICQSVPVKQAWPL